MSQIDNAIEIKKSVISQLEHDVRMLLTPNEEKEILVKCYTDRLVELKNELLDLEDKLDAQQRQSIYDYSAAYGMAGDI